MARFKQALRDQWAILAIDERAAIESLPKPLPANGGERRALLDMIKSIIAATNAVDPDVQHRLREIEVMFAGPTLERADLKVAR